MEKIKISVLDLKSEKPPILKVKLNQQYKIVVQMAPTGKTCAIEVDSALFNPDSAFLLPQGRKTEKNGKEVITSGIVTCMRLFQHILENPEKKVLILGHTDSSDTEKHNFELSFDRAKSIYYLLVNDRKKWVDTIEKRVFIDKQNDTYRNMDIRCALSWIAHEVNIDWESNPYKIDGSPMDEDDRCAISNFRNGYKEEFNGPYTNAKLGASYWGWMHDNEDPGWGAVFDIVQRMFEEHFYLTKEQFEKYRSAIKKALTWENDTEEIPYAVIGCGEYHPLDKYVDNVKESTFRRVEFLLFDPDEVTKVSDLPCHADSCRKEYCKPTSEGDKCPIYGRCGEDAIFKRELLNVKIPPREFHFSHALCDDNLLPIANKSYSISLAEKTITGTTDENGVLKQNFIPAGDFKLAIDGHTAMIPAVPRSVRKRRQIVLPRISEKS